jgi:hypothetical protein
VTGLAADGRTLVLAELLGGAVPRTTRLLVLDTPRLAVRTRVALPGWSIVDAISPDARWLYLIHYPSSGNLISASGAPFIHALDTVGVRAVCVDLPRSLAQLDIGNAQLSLGAGGNTIRIEVDGVTRAVIDTHTLAATVVQSAPLITESTFTTPAPVAPRASTRDPGGVSWEILAAAAARAAVGGAVRLRTRPKI